MRNFIITFLIIILIFCFSSCSTSSYYVNGRCIKIDTHPIEEIENRFIKDLNLESYKIIDSSDLTLETIENRYSTTIIERCIGMVTNKQNGDGLILNTNSKEYPYISYHEYDEVIHNGTIFVSYLIYNPENNCIDDIIGRYDYILSREYEVPLIYVDDSV